MNEAEEAEVLSRYVDVIIAHGVDSPEASKFRSEHEGNKGLIELLDTIDELKKEFREDGDE